MLVACQEFYALGWRWVVVGFMKLKARQAKEQRGGLIFLRLLTAFAHSFPLHMLSADYHLIVISHCTLCVACTSPPFHLILCILSHGRLHMLGKMYSMTWKLLLVYINMHFVIITNLV